MNTTASLFSMIIYSLYMNSSATNSSAAIIITILSKKKLEESFLNEVQEDIVSLIDVSGDQVAIQIEDRFGEWSMRSYSGIYM